MTKKFLATDKIGKIVANYPQTVEIFKAMNIDFCCGGNRELTLAVEEAGISVDEIIEKLNTAVNNTDTKHTNPFDALNAKQGELIEYIVQTHHEYLKKTLPELSGLTATILRAHSERHGEELSMLKRLFEDLSTELLQHLEKEENIVFPLINEYEQNPTEEIFNTTSRVIAELEEEHENAGGILKELRRVTSQYTVPEDACPTFHLTYRLLEEVESDIFNHIHLENNILIPRFLEKR